MAFKIALLKHFQEFGVLWGHKPPILRVWPCNEPFSAPNCCVSVCLASLCLRQRNLGSGTHLQVQVAQVGTGVRHLRSLHPRMNSVYVQPGLRTAAAGHASLPQEDEGKLASAGQEKRRDQAPEEAWRGSGPLPACQPASNKVWS